MKVYSPRVTRRDFTKVHGSFVPPSLPSLQVDAYRRFLDEELAKIIAMFFPIRSPNGKFSVEFNGIEFAKPELSEKQARIESKTYDASLYVDLSLINNETGDVKKATGNKRAKKAKPEVSKDGIFFAKIPLMTDKGAFLVNGIEKFVISQITRSPGAYIQSKSQVKLSNSRKRNQEGYVCEMLPSKGTLMLICIPKNKDFVQAIVRDVTGEAAKVFSVTTILKAFGLTEAEILRVFDDSPYIVRSLRAEHYNRQQILRDPEIVSITKNYAAEEDAAARHARGPLIDAYLRDLVVEYTQLNSKIETYLDEQGEAGVKPQKNKPDETLSAMEADAFKLLDKIICERTAKHVVHELSISTKSLDASDTTINPSYQLLLWQHFFTKRRYDLSLPGRYKFTRKMRLTERLYQRVLAQDLLSVDGKPLLTRGTLLLKDEIDKIKQWSRENKLAITQDVHFLNSEINEASFKQPTAIEKVAVFANNEDHSSQVSLLGIDGGDDSSDTLRLIDLLAVISYIINLPHGIGYYDDIEHLGNKRLKLVNELLYGRIQTGMMRMERYIREKLAIADGANKNVEVNEEGDLVENKRQKARQTVKSVINAKPFQFVIKDFFNTHQLTQFLDQQNPLSELTNKRRISAMGPGGISREDPNLDIRDVHYSHYGRICPIETPEGMNIGLIMSQAFYAMIDKNGFLMSPYRKVVNGKITDQVEYLTALREDEYTIAESSAAMRIGADGKILDKQIITRYRAVQELADPKRVDYIDVAPRQVLSIAAGLIPFLENDDSARALMGANMQRQATPLLKPYAPVVGTGAEHKIAHDSGMIVLAKNAGKVVNTEGGMIKVKNEAGKTDTYELVKFEKSNQNTCYNQTPIVQIGDHVEADQAIADGPAMRNGELALGQNVLVAFTTWRGYNYEDAIIISDRLFRNDVYTSVHISEYSLQCVRTRNGDEEITRDIPNVNDEVKRYLDKDGVIMVGAEVHEGDILVGKISPRGQVDLSAEEKLLQAIFGEKTKNVRESSLKVPNGGDGTVVGVRRFSIAKGDELDDDVIELVKVFIAQKRKIQIGDKLAGRHGNKGIISKIVPLEDMPHLEDGTPIDIMLNPIGVPPRMNIGQVFEMHLGLAAREMAKKELLTAAFDNHGGQAYLSQLFGLSPYAAADLVRALRAHLNERKIKNIDVAREKVRTIDLDIALRQVGLSYDDLAYKIATPVFEGVNMSDLKDVMHEAGIDAVKTHGKFKLIDGRTGEPFEKPITVGVMYMLKLDHMVDDKIHSRAVGPYSKITQQPLGGKSQNGGQRFGEMEVWALQAYGAAHNLRELLTLKSDDVRGRNLMYNAIIKGRQIPVPGIPESFKLLTKELQGLGLEVSLIYEDNTKDDINSYSVVNGNDDTELTADTEHFASDFTLDDDDKY